MFMSLGQELARNSQPRNTRPTSKRRSVVLAAMPSAHDSNGWDDSPDCMVMMSPLAFGRTGSAPGLGSRRMRSYAWLAAGYRSDFPSDHAIERALAAAA